MFFSIFIIIEACSAALLLEGYDSWSVVFWHVVSTQAVFAMFIATCTLIFEVRIRNIFGSNPDKVPIWWPVTRDVDLLQTLLPKEKQGKLRKLQAANQYVEVTTDKGKHDLRISLKSLLELVAENEGIHLHRSIWLHRDQIKELVYDKGNPRVIDINGDFIPVSRGKIDKVKDVIQARAFSQAESASILD